MEDDEFLNVENHRQYQLLVEKLQWLTYTRPAMAYFTQELARSPRQTTKYAKELTHLVRYLPPRNQRLRILCETKTTMMEDNNPLKSERDALGPQFQHVLLYIYMLHGAINIISQEDSNGVYPSHHCPLPCLQLHRTRTQN